MTCTKELMNRTRREEARVEAVAAMDAGRRMYRYGCAVARKYGHTDLLPGAQTKNSAFRS